MSGQFGRRRAREFALQGIYQWLLSGNTATAIAEHAADVNGFDKADVVFYRQMLQAVLSEASELEAAFAPFIRREVHALSPVERAILLMATYELCHHPETPYRVILNEAIELAKRYGGTDGHRFINGVLDRLASQLRELEVGAHPEVGDSEDGAACRE